MKILLLSLLLSLSSTAFAAESQESVQPLAHSCEGLDSIGNLLFEGLPQMDQTGLVLQKDLHPATRAFSLSSGKIATVAQVVSDVDNKLHILILAENSEGKMDCSAISQASGLGFDDFSLEAMTFSEEAATGNLVLEIPVEVYRSREEGMDDGRETLNSNIKVILAYENETPSVTALSIINLVIQNQTVGAP